jgi:hypothetical protein
MRSSALSVAIILLIIGDPSHASAQAIIPDRPRSGDAPASPGEVDDLRGLGAYYDDMGNYKVKSAVADKLEMSNQIQWNQYIYDMRCREVRDRIAGRGGVKRDQNIELSKKIRARIRDNPEDRDLMNGDALNVLLEELCNPKIHPSAMRASEVRIPGETIRLLSFMYGQMGGVISMRQLTVRDGWPLALRDEAYAADRRAYMKAVDRVLELILKDKLSNEAIKALEVAIAQLKARAKTQIPSSEVENGRQARVFIDGLENSARIVRAPLAEDVFSSIEKYSGRTVAELLDFMRRYNLRFSPAGSPAERDLYPQMYHSLLQQRRALAANDPARYENLNPEEPVDVAARPVNR